MSVDEEQRTLTLQTAATNFAHVLFKTSDIYLHIAQPERQRPTWHLVLYLTVVVE